MLGKQDLACSQMKPARILYYSFTTIPFSCSKDYLFVELLFYSMILLSSNVLV